MIIRTVILAFGALGLIVVSATAQIEGGHGPQAELAAELAPATVLR